MKAPFTRPQPKLSNEQMIDCLLGKYGSQRRTAAAGSVARTMQSYSDFTRYIQTSIIYRMMKDRSSAGKAEFTLAKMGLKENLVPCIGIFTDWYKPLHKVLGDVTLADIVLPFPKCVVSMSIDAVTYTALVTQETPESEVQVAQLIGHDDGSTEVLTEDAIGESREKHYENFTKYFTYAMIASEVNLAEKVPVAGFRTMGAPVLSQEDKGYEYRIVPIRKTTNLRHGDVGTGSKKRFHFRRSHTRTYANGHKVRIGWMFVGDIELGFVDKDYAI